MKNSKLLPYMCYYVMELMIRNRFRLNPTKLLFAGILFLCISSAYAQEDLKNWNSIQADLSLSKKLDLRIGQLWSFDTRNRFAREFSQTSVRMDYDLTKQFSLSCDAVLGGFSLADGASRLTLRSTYRIPLTYRLTWSNSLQGETHSANETRYQYRIVYITRISTKNRLDFLRLRPSVSYNLYYNIGGNPIQYYNQQGDLAVKQSPDGLHRGRLSLNLNSRITKNLSFSIYGMMQREFNLFTGDYHKINVVNPVSGRIVRRFNNYNVIGTTLTANFDLYKKPKKKSSKDNKADSNL